MQRQAHRRAQLVENQQSQGGTRPRRTLVSRTWPAGMEEDDDELDVDDLDMVGDAQQRRPPRRRSFKALFTPKTEEPAAVERMGDGAKQPAPPTKPGVPPLVRTDSGQRRRSTEIPGTSRMTLGQGRSGGGGRRASSSA